MPRMTDAHIDRALTNMSVAYIQDAGTFISDKVFPVVPVKRQSDLYFIYNTGDFMRDEATVRGLTSESTGGDYDLSTDSYYCKIYAFHKDVSPQERVNYDDPLDADQDAEIFVSQKMLVRREMQWAANYFASGVWTRQMAGQATADATHFVFWNLGTSTPIEDVTSESIRMASLTGYRPNTMVLSPYVFNALKNHPEVLDRIKYTEKGIVTTQLLASLFEMDNVYVAWAVVNSAVKGATDAVSFIMGKNALLCYSNPNPALRQPSAGYTFAWTGLEGAGAFGNRIVRIPMDMLGLGTERIEGEIAFDTKKVADALGSFLYAIVQ